MDFKKIVMERGMKVMSDPRFMKLMSNPKVMNLMMQAFQVRTKATASIDEKRRAFAKALKLVTRDELSELKSTLRSLQQTIEKMQQAEKTGSKK